MAFAPCLVVGRLFGRRLWLGQFFLRAFQVSKQADLWGMGTWAFLPFQVFGKSGRGNRPDARCRDRRKRHVPPLQQNGPMTHFTVMSEGNSTLELL
jgi:hypothetical protein